MALIDDPRAWILRLFEMEQQEGRGAHCQRFPDGTTPDDIPLDDGERVYGIYKNKYYFTPTSFIMRRRDGIQRVAWKVCRCSSEHGEGAKTARLVVWD